MKKVYRIMSIISFVIGIILWLFNDNNFCYLILLAMILNNAYSIEEIKK